MRVFSFFIQHSNSVTPTLMFEVASDEARVRALAEAALAESPHRLAVEVREDDRLLFTVDRSDVSWGDHPGLLVESRGAMSR